MRLFTLFFLCLTPLFAIVDIATIDFGDKPEGFSGAAYGSFQKKRGNTDKDEAEYGGRIQYDTKKTITWLQGEVEKDEASGVLTDDNSFLHLRHVHQLYSEDWASEYFVQIRRDKFKSIQQRKLFGAGLRYRIMYSDTYGKLFLGLAVMDEQIDYIAEEPDPDEHNYRMSSYISYKVPVNEVFDLGYLGYYQPKIDNGSDYITASIMEMTIHLTKTFDLSYMIEFDYDTKPAFGVQKRDLTQKLSFIYRFGEGDPFSEYAHSFLSSTDALEDTEAVKDAIAVEVETEVEEVKDSSDIFAGEWHFKDEHLSISLDGTGSYQSETGPYKEGLKWKVIATETQEGIAGAQNQGTKLVIIRFVDEEGRDGRVENYLWNNNTLVGLSDTCIRQFKR